MAAALAGCLTAVARAGDAEIPGSAAEFELKSAYLLNFARFVDWPDSAFTSAASEIRIGILGPGPHDRQVEMGMEERAIRGRPIRVVWLEHLDSMASCHIVYVPRSAAHPEGVAAATVGKPVLTVGESDAFAAGGGVIQLYLEDEVVRFEINRSAAERNGLTISSRLLSLARLTPVAAGPAGGASP